MPSPYALDTAVAVTRGWEGATIVSQMTPLHPNTHVQSPLVALQAAPFRHEQYDAHPYPYICEGPARWSHGTLQRGPPSPSSAVQLQVPVPETPSSQTPPLHVQLWQAGPKYPDPRAQVHEPSYLSHT
eukprot:Opistho-1_new@64458